MWPLQSTWYPVVAVLMTWIPPELWEAIDGSPICTEKALHSLEEQLLEKAWAVAGQVGWVLLMALKQNMDEALAEAVQVQKLRQKADALDTWV